MKRILSILLALCLLSAGLVCAADSDYYQSDWLVAERAVQISSNQIVVEFSEPIAINLNQKKGPFVSVRLVSKNGSGVKYTDDKTTYLQWQFSMQYLDSKHDRLLLTMSTAALQVNDLDEIRAFSGPLAQYADRDWEMRLVIEELPDDKTDYSDFGVCNITSTDGSKMLFPTNVWGYEAVSLSIDRDLSYEYDKNLVESTKSDTALSPDAIVILDAEEYRQEHDDSVRPTHVTTVQVVQNNPLLIAGILGGSALIGAAILVVVLLLGKKRKAAK